MLILSIDSAGAACGICVWQNGKVLAQSVEPMQRGQDARLMPMVVDVLARAGIGFSDLDKVAVTRGPGSFTGVRVGLAAARGIGLAAGKPVIGIDRFAIYHAACGSDKDLLVVIDSKRAELFCKFFPVAGAAYDACLMTQAQVDAFVVDHSDTIIAGDIVTSDVDVTLFCAQLAAGVETGNATPLYLRAPDVSFPKSSNAR